MLKDIECSADIEVLVNSFYDKIKTNAILGYIFSDIAKVNWETHLPGMYAFWGSILLNEHSFSGNPMQKHLELSKLTKLTDREFSEWISLFTQTVDGLYAGEKAEEAKLRATNIAHIMLSKISKE